MKDTVNYQKIILNLKGILRTFNKPLVMGIINATPDSFFADSRSKSVTDSLVRAEKMILEGAAIIDVGGYSTRPGADEVSETEELSRVLPIIEGISTNFPDTLISIDSFRSVVAEESLCRGASILNDITGGVADPRIFDVAAQANAPVVLMHMRGTPKTMSGLTDYTDLIKEVKYFFEGQILKAKAAGVTNIIIDPGFGFSKKIDQNFELLAHLNSFVSSDHPLLVGVSRKSMIYNSLKVTSDESLNGTTVLNTVALLKGASILRVHDVKEAVQAVELVSRL